MAEPKTYLNPLPPKGYARNPELEAAVLANPTDPAPYLVYADWLTQQGDPRGELVVVQHKIAGGDASMKAREAVILAENHHFLGGIVTGAAPGHFKDVGDGIVTLAWKWGFFAKARLFNTIDWMDGGFPAREICARLFALPAACALAELDVGVLRWEYQGDDIKALIEEAGRSTFAPNLSVLRLGDVEGIDIDCAHHPLGDLSGISKTFPKLRTLTMWGCELTLGTIALPELRKLAVQTCGLSSANLASILGAQAPNLEHLEIWFGSEDYGSDSSVDDLAPLLEGGRFPKLKHLGLMNCEYTDAICAALATSKLVSQLESLDLSMGTMSEEGARALVEHRKALGHLQRIDVSDNFLTPEAITSLGNLGPAIESGTQKDYAEDYRYVSVAE